MHSRADTEGDANTDNRLMRDYGQRMGLGLKLSDCFLRPMKWADREQVRGWRNQPAVRRVMFTDHEIGSGEHCRWFHQVLSSDAYSYHVFEYQGRPVGLVGFFKLESASGSGEWTFYIAEGNVPRGTGIAMLYTGLDFFFGSRRMSSLFANVIAWNEESLALHRRFGFVQDSTKQIERADGVHEVVCLVLTKAKWEGHRDAMSSFIRE